MLTGDSPFFIEAEMDKLSALSEMVERQEASQEGLFPADLGRIVTDCTTKWRLVAEV